MKAIIVEDEPLAQEILQKYLANTPEVELVAVCANALEARNVLSMHEVDLMFLDIQMPQLLGTEFLKTLQNPPVTIMTTAYPDYAVESFDLDVCDYLLKPIPFERFLKALNKAIDQIHAKRTENSVQMSGSDQASFFFVKADKKLVKVNFDDIIYIEGLKDYVIIRLDQSRIITLQTMKSLEDKLPHDRFMRIHRSYIVNLNHILSLDGNEVDVSEKGTTKQLPIGKNYKDELLNKINQSRI